MVTLRLSRDTTTLLTSGDGDFLRRGGEREADLLRSEEADTERLRRCGDLDAVGRGCRGDLDPER